MGVANRSSVGFGLWVRQPLEPPSGIPPCGAASVSVTLLVRRWQTGRLVWIQFGTRMVFFFFLPKIRMRWQDFKIGFI